MMSECSYTGTDANRGSEASAEASVDSPCSFFLSEFKTDLRGTGSCKPLRR